MQKHPQLLMQHFHNPLAHYTNGCIINYLMDTVADGSSIQGAVNSLKCFAEEHGVSNLEFDKKMLGTVQILYSEIAIKKVMDKMALIQNLGAEFNPFIKATNPPIFLEIGGMEAFVKGINLGRKPCGSHVSDEFLLWLCKGRALSLDGLLLNLKLWGEDEAVKVLTDNARLGKKACAVLDKLDTTISRLACKNEDNKEILIKSEYARRILCAEPTAKQTHAEMMALIFAGKPDQVVERIFSKWGAKVFTEILKSAYGGETGGYVGAPLASIRTVLIEAARRGFDFYPFYLDIIYGTYGGMDMAEKPRDSDAEIINNLMNIPNTRRVGGNPKDIWLTYPVETLKASLDENGFEKAITYLHEATGNNDLLQFITSKTYKRKTIASDFGV